MRSRIIDLIITDDYSVTPKYIQIANSVIRAIEKGAIAVGDNMPSINELSIELDIARDTVERGYKYLKSSGIIDSVPRRGYFVVNTDLKKQLKIFLLFNKLSAHKKTIYDAFVAKLGEQTVIDFYVYNNNVNLFKKLLANNRGDYSHYIIVPHFLEGEDKALEAIKGIPADKLILLDKLIENLKHPGLAAYENFENDIYNALVEALDQLAKYDTIKIIFPRYSYYPKEITLGLKRFCQDFAFSFAVIYDLENEKITKGSVYINVMEDNLVQLIDKILGTKFVLGQEVGLISYNEIPIKKYILNGITTISTDFAQMGYIAAQLVLGEASGQIEVPFRLTLRPSL